MQKGLETRRSGIKQEPDSEIEILDEELNSYFRNVLDKVNSKNVGK